MKNRKPRTFVKEKDKDDIYIKNRIKNTIQARKSREKKKKLEELKDKEIEHLRKTISRLKKLHSEEISKIEKYYFVEVSKLENDIENLKADNDNNKSLLLSILNF